MRRLLLLLAFTAAANPQQPLTLQQLLSAPYALSLIASPVGPHFAWIENAEGRRNIWVGGPKETARQLTHYTEDDAQDLNGLTWSPDGNMLAFARGAENGASGKPANPAHLQRPVPVEIFIRPVSGGDAIKLGEGHSPLFAPDSKSVLFLRAGQIWSARIPLSKPVAPASSGQQPLLEGILGLVAAIPVPDTSKQLIVDRGLASNLVLSPDGKFLAYVSHRSGDGHNHTVIGLYGFETKELRILPPSSGNDFAPSFSPDSRQIAWLRAPSTDVPEFATNRTSADPWSIQVADVATGTVHTLFTAAANKPGSVLPHLATGEPHLLFTASNRIVFYSEADGWVHLYALNPDTLRAAAPQLLTPGNYEVEDVAVSRDGRRIVYSSNESPDRFDSADTRHLWELDLATASPERKNLTYDPAFQNIDTHPALAADGTLAFIETSMQDPAYAAFINPDGPDIVALHTDRLPPSYPQHTFADRPRSLISPMAVIFPSADRVVPKLHAQLFRPHADEGDPHGHRFPAIIFVHGGPRRQMLLGYPPFDYYSNTYAMNQYLALHGFIVLSVNYRCGIGYGLDFRQCEHSGADGATEYNDVLGAAAYLRSRPDVDTAHIGIWGGSYGGYLTALALARNSDIFAAGVDFHGIHEWSLESNAKADWLRGPNIEQIAARAHASSPMADVGKWKSPILLIHGDDDPEVNFAQTPLLANALRARNIHVEELIFPDEVHDFLLHKDWLAAFQATADFFDRTLKPAGNSHKIP